MDKGARVILAFIGIFVAGGISGGLLGVRVGKHVSEARRLDSLQDDTARPSTAPVGMTGPSTTPSPTPSPGPVAVTPVPATTPAVGTPTMTSATPPAPVVASGPQQLGPQLMRRFTEQLSLTREQREKIKPIEARTTEDLRRLRRETEHSTELIIERMHDEVSAVLTPTQQVKFDEMMARARERIKKFIQDQERARQAPARRASEVEATK